MTKEYFREALKHMHKSNIAFCYSESGEMITIGRCKRELGIYNCPVCDNEIEMSCFDCNKLVSELK